MKKFFIPVALVAILTTSCVSKKKYTALETKYVNTKGNLQKTTLEKEALEAKFAKIEDRVENYNNKINSLKSDNVTLKNENDIKLDMVGNTAVISNNTRKRMNETLAKVDPEKLAKAKTLKDSLNLAVSYNLINNVGLSDIKNSEDIDINIDQTVVMISVSDKLLFNTASYRVKKSAYKLITQLADIIKSEPSMDVMIEGHTDSRTINNAVIEDNWDLSVKRATSIVRLLQNKFDIEGSRLIASGRGDTMPLFPNTNSENRAKNRRTRIVILPNLDKFFALLANEGVIEKQ
ncbi:cell envelope biogenesis protein OmpA [Polaribacter aestuariivivens]|uniref:Cell envelope biogenesis protein OmpA n=1 Tax=Polaribacter aestuariivivens TaxID=2304626 RepID=A0A5S3N0N5_9FLAO|nr:OmpA family protein [Polaribacter aestuariivivens]TMM28841.1 cell envelope biogenesis protein OmpA [Polaribacter aestuariivivens]